MNINIDSNNSIDDSFKTDNKNTIKKIIIIISIIILCIVFLIVYARYKATSGIKVNEYKITNNIIPDSFHGFKIVQISDIYYNNTVNLKYLKYIVNKINEIKPDILVFTGDFTNTQIDENTQNEIISTLNSINTTVGKYAISGDIDDTNLFNKIFSSSNFINLNQKTEYIYYNSNKPIIISNNDETIPNDLFSILLIHKPDNVDNLNNNFNLILAGHSLGGQINLPIIRELLLQDGAKKYYSGYYSEKNLYVSTGIGTTNFKYRFLNKPSINLYRLTKY